MTPYQKFLTLAPDVFRRMFGISLDNSAQILEKIRIILPGSMNGVL